MKKIIIWIVVIIIIIVGIAIATSKSTSNEALKIGVITPLTGGVAYWGESTRLGIELAKADLVKENIQPKIIVEDGGLDPKMALNAAQKLVNTDGVQAIYSEFNPAAIAVSSFLKGKSVIHISDSAAESFLADGSNMFKTYLDYRTSCKEAALYLKNTKNIQKVGVLKMNLEHGDLCLAGIKEVYADAVVESYNPGSTDFRTSLTKLRDQKVQAVFHASFQPETLASLKQIKALGWKTQFVGLAETVTPDVIPEYGTLLDGAVMFGLPKVSDDFVARIEKQSGKKPADQNAAALAYIHIKQLAHALSECGNKLSCTEDTLNKSPAEPEAGFLGFTNHIGKFESRTQEWKGGAFQDVR